MTDAEFVARWGKLPEGWEGKRVSYTGGCNFALPGDPWYIPEADGPVGLCGEGVVTAEIPCPKSSPYLNVDCDTHGPVTVDAENCAVVLSPHHGQTP